MCSVSNVVDNQVVSSRRLALLYVMLYTLSLSHMDLSRWMP